MKRLKIVYLKQEYRRNAGRLNITKYIRINSDGIFTIIDITRNIIKKGTSFGSLPFGKITPSTELEFKKAKTRVLNKLNIK